MSAPALRIDRSRLPQPSDGSPFVFPPIEKSVLPNGLGVWTVRHDAVSWFPKDTSLLVSVDLRQGSPAKGGANQAFMDLMFQQMPAQAKAEFYSEIEKLGNGKRFPSSRYGS